MSRINPTPQKFDEGRLSQVLVAPIISEKATRIGEKQNQVMFKVLREATKPGEPAPLPDDWSFTDAQREVAIEVRTPWALSHSVTIWCASADGALFVAARDPDEKRWPDWVERDPAVRLGIDGRLYDAKLVRVEDPARIATVRRAYAAKYALEDPPPEGAPPVRYWQVVPRG